MVRIISQTLLTVLSVNLLATSGDITMTWSSPVLSKLETNDTSDNPLGRTITDTEESLIASLINIGAFVGVVPFSFISERYGRKIALLTIGTFHTIAYIVMAFAKNVYYFYFGRLFGGLAVGGGYTILPMYIAEIVEEPKRGFYSTTLGIFWSFGNFWPYAVGPFTSNLVFNLLNAAFPITFLAIFFFVGTETPYFLMAANRVDEAEQVLMNLRTEDNYGIKVELKHIKETLEQEKGGPTSLKEIAFNKGLRKAFIISISLISLQQFSGWNAITFYLQPIFEDAGTDLPAYLSSLIVGSSILIFSIPVPYLAHRINRKVLVIFSCIGMCFCLTAIGIFYYIKDRTSYSAKPISWIPLAAMLLITITFDCGMAGMPWTISSELFPKNVKKLSASATSAACWLTSFLMTNFLNDMLRIFGNDGTFFMFAGFCVVTILFTAFYIPETRNRTFKDIQQLLQN